VRRDQVEDLCALSNRAVSHEGVPRVIMVDEFEETIEAPYLDLDLDARAAYRDGQLVGWTWVWNPPSEHLLERAYLFGDVDPAARGQGVGHALLGWGVARAEERLRSRDHDLPRYVRVEAYDWMEANHHLYGHFGFTPARWFEELVRPLVDLPTIEPVDGVAFVPWPAEQDEVLLAVRNAAFADHWGSAPVDPAWWQATVRGHGARPDLSVIAVEEATGQPVALCLNHAYPEDDERTGRQEAWIENLGTVRPWRARGLASGLLAWSMHAFADTGFSHAMIAVDSDNPTGAARLYRSLGFERERRSITHQLEITV
jgi:mycothiol synthase